MKKKNFIKNILIGAFIPIKNLFSFERGPCRIMEYADESKIKFKSIPVSYPKCIIQGVEREARVKIWNVAVKTANPEFFCRTHAEWMVEIQFTHAHIHSVIGEYERIEILSGLRSYSQNIPLRSPAYMKNN